MADNLSKLGTAVIKSTKTNKVSLLRGVFISSEVEDANLSKISLSGGSVARWVPKFKHVGSMSNGDQVVLISEGNSYIILGVGPIGDVTLANSGM